MEMVIDMVRKDVVERVEKVIELMKEGMDLTSASKAVGTDVRTVKKVMKLLKVGRKKRKGRVYIITEYYKGVIDKMIYLMSGGWSASRSVRTLHTTLTTMKKMKVAVDGVAQQLLDTTDGRYSLNVYKIYGYPTVFFGRLKSNAGNVVTETTPRKLELEPDDIRDDDYANILWQIDFDPFRSTLMPEDVCEFYPQKVLAAIRDELIKKKYPLTHPKVFKGVASLVSRIDATGDKSVTKGRLGVGSASDIPFSSVMVSMLDIIFGQIGADFDEEVECGIDDRGVTEKYLTRTDFETNNKVTDDGAFEIIIRRRSRSYIYPSKPYIIPYEHDLEMEALVPRRTVF